MRAVVFAEDLRSDLAVFVAGMESPDLLAIAGEGALGLALEAPLCFAMRYTVPPQRGQACGTAPLAAAVYSSGFNSGSLYIFICWYSL